MSEWQDLQAFLRKTAEGIDVLVRSELGSESRKRQLQDQEARLAQVRLLLSQEQERLQVLQKKADTVLSEAEAKAKEIVSETNRRLADAENFKQEAARSRAVAEMDAAEARNLKEALQREASDLASKKAELEQVLKKV